MAVTVALDAFQAIPFAWLRYQHRPIKFFALKLLFIVLNITLNIFYFVVLPALYVRHAWVGAIYDPSVGPGYAFILNLVCTSFITFFFIPELTGFKYQFDTRLMKRMLGYSWPILILGIAGILNQTADKIIFPLVYGDTEAAKSELGIYGACVKIAMIMAMITQAFRYAYEPFVFGKAKDKNSGETYATVMKFFIIFTLLAYLCVIGYMDILKRIIAPDYWPGLRVVPIVMAAEIMMGVYFNLSFWYKLIDKTIWGAWFSAAGCLVLFAVNIIFIPTYSYMACAWGGFAGYATAMLLSYIVGQKKNPVRYPLKSIGIYVLIAGGFYAIMACTPEEWPVWTRLGINTVLILLFVGHILKHDLPVRSLPVIMENKPKKQRSYLNLFIRRLLSMKEDKAPEEETIASIKAGIDFRGANLWILIFAIFVASLGLNTNSAAVIIGAMLISPLMGPIVGMGLGVGIYDFELLKRAFRSFATATIFSVLTATFYFAITPINEAQSELLARTSPTIYDVLIALFGGLAGIVALCSTGQRGGNVIPGVAIATAIMPPLCTTGFGLATGNWL